MNNLEIVEKAYAQAVQGIKEEWFKNTNTKWYDYIIQLPRPFQITYFIVVLQNQIYNGGFHQYFVNGYGQFAKDTINALIELSAFRKAELVKMALNKVNAYNYSDEIFRKKLLEFEIEELFVGDNLFDPLNELDEEYYANEEDLNQLLIKYLQNG